VLGPDGRLVIATFDPDYFDDHWLSRFFPSLEAIDRAQFSAVEVLVGELEEAGFGPVRALKKSQGASVSRETALARVRGRYVSPLQLLDEDEYGAGLGRMERELPEQVDYTLKWFVVIAERP
jgi:hypothetical protein